MSYSVVCVLFQSAWVLTPFQLKVVCFDLSAWGQLCLWGELATRLLAHILALLCIECIY